MDLRALSDDDLDEHRVAVASECERRANLAAIPDQVRSLAKVYRDGGGDESELQGAVAAPDEG